VDTVQRGYRGLGMELVYNPRTLAESVEANIPPEPETPVSDQGPKAGDALQNVQILGDLSVAQFTRLMSAMTKWVSPEAGCNYCHVQGNFASDDIYTKKVSRVMTAMTQKTNQDWQSHVADTGVTCYTCHRGEPIPTEVWAEDPGPRMPGSVVDTGQNRPTEEVALSSLPADPFTAFLDEDRDARIIPLTVLPQQGAEYISVKEAEWTYAIMMHLSTALNANCTYCHNSRSFMSWDQSSPARITAWHAIRNVREINNGFIEATTDILPESGKGPLGDPLKASCATCHRGAYKPLYGASMLKDYPSLAELSGDAKVLSEEAGQAVEAGAEEQAQ
jgi:photosynthetic reaction center cytochrome c subunit